MMILSKTISWALETSHFQSVVVHIIILSATRKVFDELLLSLGSLI